MNSKKRKRREKMNWELVFVPRLFLIMSHASHECLAASQIVRTLMRSIGSREHLLQSVVHIVIAVDIVCPLDQITFFTCLKTRVSVVDSKAEIVKQFNILICTFQ